MKTYLRDLCSNAFIWFFCFQDGGLYDKLYLCLFYTVAELAKMSNSIFGKNSMPNFKITQL